MLRNSRFIYGFLGLGLLASLGSCKEGAKASGQVTKASEPVRCEAEMTPETVAFIGQQPVTMSDLDKAEVNMDAKQQAFEAQGKFFEIREALLNEHIFGILAEKEAKAKGITREELVKKEVAGKISKVSEADVQAFYQNISAEWKKAGRSAPPLDNLAGKIREHLENEASGKRQEVYFGELRKKYDVKYVDAKQSLSKPRYTVAVGELPIKGDPKAPVTIVEFSHYKCPHCGTAAKTLSQVAQAYPGVVKIYFRDFPLGQDAASKAPAVAARCAAAQGKFWEYHDVLFQNQRSLGSDQLVEYAKGLKLDMESFDACQKDPEVVKQVDADQAAGQSLGVRGTPAIFINGVKLGGAVPFEQFEAIIDEELKVAGVTKPDKKVMP